MEELMKNKRWSLRLGRYALFLSGALFSSNAFAQTLKEVAKFDLPGPGGKRFDYLTIDEGDHYLISAHLAAEYANAASISGSVSTG
jgi:hypothetical protein